MASWVYADDFEIQELQKEVDKYALEGQNKIKEEQKDNKIVLTFWVEYNDSLNCNEHIGLTGNNEKLGNWQPDEIVIMKSAGEFRHTIDLVVEKGIDIQYRYVVCGWNPTTEEITITKWETHLKPRSLKFRYKTVEKFGWFNDEYKVSNAWVRPKAQVVSFQLFNAPFIWPDGAQSVLLYVKLVPMCAMHIDETEPNDELTIGPDVAPVTEFIKVEVKNLARMKNDNLIQPEFGVRCGPNDIIQFDMIIKDVCLTLYRFDVYTYGNNVEHMENCADIEPCYFGSGYVEPEELMQGNTYIKLYIREPKSKDLRCLVKLSYLVVTPYAEDIFTLEKTYQHYWNTNKHVAMSIGHRGCGNTFQQNGDLVRENTIYSLNRAAQHGAEMVEFDVQLSKDAKPIVFHDRVFYMPMQTPPFTKMLKEHEVFVFPQQQYVLDDLIERATKIKNGIMTFSIEAFTAEELQSFKIYRFAKPKKNDKNNGTATCEELLEDQMPFVALEKVMTEVDASTAFAIEVKYPQKLTNNQWEGDGCRSMFERNFYIDRILEIVLRHAGARRIVFKSFDCSCCILLRYKQNMYPVLLLVGDPHKEIQYRDNRINNFRNAVFTAKTMQLSGLSLHTNTILDDPQSLKCAKAFNLIVFCWGEANNDEETRMRLKSHGIHGIVYDRIDQSEGKVIKPLLFKLETWLNMDYLNCVRLSELKKLCGK